MLSPNVHVRTLVELLRAGGPDLGRRWLAALLSVPEGERAAIVEAVEGRIAALYRPGPAPAGQKRNARAGKRSAHTADSPHSPEREIVVVYPARQRRGYTEQVERTYAPVEPKPVARSAKRPRRA